jgi:hypothetical protein
MRTLFALAIVGMFVVACSGGPETPGETVSAELKGAPQWVLGGCGSFASDQTPICGVGSGSGTRNPAAARSMAVGRARTDLARNLQVKVKALYKDYMSTTTGGEDFGKAANDEQHVVDVAKQITKTTLSGTSTDATWVSNTGTVWMLVSLKPEAFSKALSQMKQLDETVRRAIVERADKAFKELDEATDFQK